MNDGTERIEDPWGARTPYDPGTPWQKTDIFLDYDRLRAGGIQWPCSGDQIRWTNTMLKELSSQLLSSA